MFLFIVWTLNPLKRFLFIKASTNTIRFRNKPVIEKKRGKRIWNISNIFLSSCFWNHFQLTFYPYELLIHLPYKDALEGWWLFFFLPSNAKFSSSFVGAFVSFKEFIFFFSPSCNLYTSPLLFFEREERRTFPYFNNESN